MSMWTWFAMQQLPSRRKRPALGMIDLMLLRGHKEDGSKMSMFEHGKEGFKNGLFYAAAAEDFMRRLAARFMPDPDRKTRRLKDGFFKDMEDMEDGKNRSEINPDDADRTQAGKGRDFTKVEDPNALVVRSPYIRVRVEPEDQKNRVGSNHVGPDRQLRRNDDPWPIAGPEKKAAPRGLPAPEVGEARNAIEGVSGPREITGPEKRPALESPEASARRLAGVSDIADARAKRSGKEAADKGAAKARETSAGGSKSKKKTRQSAEPEL